MEEKKKKLTQKELKEEIKSLPPPSFNDPEKVQPKIVVPSLISTEIKGKKFYLGADEKRQRITDPELIISKKGARIEKLHRPKKQKVLRQVFRYARPHWIYLVLALLFALINSVLELMIPILAGRGIDLIIGPGQVDYNGLLTIIFWLIGAAVGFALFRWLTNYTANVLCFKTARSMREDIFKKLNKVPLKYIDGTSHGDLQSRMINDVEQITDGFLVGITTFFDCLVSIVLTIYLMFTINVNITLVILALTPLSIMTTAIIAYRSNKYFRRQARALGDISGNIIETLGNQKVVIAFNYQDRAINKFETLNKNLNEHSEKAMFYSSLTNPFSRFINGIIYAIVAIMGTYYAVGGLISVGSISVLLSYANKYIKPFNEISDVFGDLQAAYASAKRVLNVLDIQDEPSDASLPVLKRCSGNVTLKDVDFSYSPNKKLIEDLNVSVKKGQRVAIVGPTGCGKSTLINLLMRFYDVNEGDIYLGSKSIYEIKRSSLRSKYGMVLQDSWLFSSTIRDNIAYGKPDASLEEVVRAAKQAYAHDFIMTLENGYDTVINENGDNLSQGQKQLICIARIMLTRPPMLILDEATSNIDTRTELYIQEAFGKMMEGRTSFVVAHRLSTIVGSDLILVMNKGQIIEQGTHDQLMEKKGFYYNLYNSQFSKY